MISKEICASQYWDSKYDKENRVSGEFSHPPPPASQKEQAEGMQKDWTNENYATLNSKWIEVACESEYGKDFKTMLNNDNLSSDEKRGNRFRRSIKEDQIELSPVVKLIHSPESRSEYGGTIDIPVSVGFAKADTSHLVTNFELEIVESQAQEICQLHYK